MTVPANTLWFDVEKRYKAILLGIGYDSWKLWFDVEKRYKAIKNNILALWNQLWFDVEKRYKAMRRVVETPRRRCGLM